MHRAVVLGSPFSGLLERNMNEQQIISQATAITGGARC